MLAAPTSAGAISLLLAVALSLVSLRASNPWLLLVGSALFSPVLISQLIRPELGSITIGFGPADRIAVGGSLAQVYCVHNRGRRSSPGFRLTHSHDGFQPNSVAVPSLPPGARVELPVRWIAVRRTVSDQHTLRLISTAPFGMATYRRRLQVTAKVSVYPATGPVPDLAAAVWGDQAGGRPARFGPDLHGLREWQPGDALRQVHWRATARHDRLTVAVPESTLLSQVAFVVSGPEHMVGAEDGDDADRVTDATRVIDAASIVDTELVFGSGPAAAAVPVRRWEALLSTAAWTAVDASTHGQGLVRLSASGAPDYLGKDADAILDWFAGLGSVGPASQDVLRAAADWAAAAGLLIMASTQSLSVDHGWASERFAVLEPDGRLSSP